MENLPGLCARPQLVQLLACCANCHFSHSLISGIDVSLFSKSCANYLRRGILCYPVSAALILLSTILADPAAHLAESDVGTIGEVVQFLERLQEDGDDVQKLLDGCLRLHQTAVCAVDAHKASEQNLVLGQVMPDDATWAQRLCSDVYYCVLNEYKRPRHESFPPKIDGMIRHQCRRLPTSSSQRRAVYSSVFQNHVLITFWMFYTAGLGILREATSGATPD